MSTARVLPKGHGLRLVSFQAPALAAGNCVVLKPSELAPLTCLRLADLFLEAGGPAGVFNVVNGLGTEAGQALALHPEILLLDEVTSALDPELVNEVLDSIRRLAKDGMTMVLVSHEMAFVREVADQVVFMDGGVVVEHGPPAQLFDNPKTDRARDFFGKILRH